MNNQDFTRTVQLGASDNVSNFNLALGYNQYHQLCAVGAFHTCDEEDSLIQEPAMVSDDEDDQKTIRAKDNPIDRTWTGHTPSVQTSEISDDEDTSDTPEEPRGVGLCIPIPPYQYQ